MGEKGTVPPVAERGVRNGTVVHRFGVVDGCSGERGGALKGCGRRLEGVQKAKC